MGVFHAERQQRRGLRLGLDALCDQAATGRPGEMVHRDDEGLSAEVGVDPPDEADVELHEVRLEFDDGPEVGNAGAGVVDRQADVPTEIPDPIAQEHEQLLARLLADLRTTDRVDLTLSGFDDDEVAKLLKGLDRRERRERPETFDLETALDAATREPRTKPGELWRLGDHRLVCGDATVAADVERLLGGRRPAMAFTDPPYNVSLGDHGGQPRSSRRRRIANDALDPVAWETFCRAWIRLLLESVDGAIYCAMSSKELPLVSRVFAEVGGHWSDTIIWAKDRFVLGRADYQRSYEPIWFGWREGSAHYWCGDRDQADVWTIARPAEAPLHPVMKPLPLMERAISNSSREGDLVLDLFLGAGSTLIAAERTGRTCLGLELDPRYCDVSLARWEAFTGEQAERVDG